MKFCIILFLFSDIRAYITIKCLTIWHQRWWHFNCCSTIMKWMLLCCPTCYNVLPLRGEHQVWWGFHLEDWGRPEKSERLTQHRQAPGPCRSSQLLHASGCYHNLSLSQKTPPTQASYSVWLGPSFWRGSPVKGTQPVRSQID